MAGAVAVTPLPLESILFSGVWPPPPENRYVLEGENSETNYLKHAVSTPESTFVFE